MSQYDEIARRHVRSEVGVDLEARIESGGHEGRCIVDNLSSGGARVNTRIPASRSDVVMLHIGSIGSVEGTVAWVNRSTLGLKFSRDVTSITDLLFAIAIY